MAKRKVKVGGGLLFVAVVYVDVDGKNDVYGWDTEEKFTKFLSEVAEEEEEDRARFEGATVYRVYSDKRVEASSLQFSPPINAFWKEYDL